MTNSKASLRLFIPSEMKVAMKAGDKKRLGVIRLVMAAIKQREVDERIELDGEQIIIVMDKMLKQRRESITQYRAAKRDDLADIESAEIDVISSFLPEQLTDEEISSMITEAIASVLAVSMRDMGKVMALVKPRMQGRADMSVVSVRIKGLLG